MLDLNQLQLPSDVREKLAELDLELSEGDITQKGYEKKRTKLLAPYLNLSDNNQLINSSIISNKNDKLEINHHISRPTEHRISNNHGLYAQAGSTTNASSNNHHLTSIINSNNFSSPQTRAKRAHRRVTRNESRYHSEVRKEAVQQAIASMKNKPKLAMPMKRNSNLSRGVGKDVRNKYNNNLRNSGRQNRSSHHRTGHLQSSSGHGTAGDSEEYESTDDDYDDEEDEDELMINESSSGTPELNLKKIKNLTITMNNHHQNAVSQPIPLPHSSSEEACSSTASSSTPERSQLNMSKLLKKQQQPLPLPPKVVAVQESHSANNYRNEYKMKDKNYHYKDYNREHDNHHKSNNNLQTHLFQLKDPRPSSKHHHSKSTKINNNSYLNSPVNRASSIQQSSYEDRPPALPQHQTKLHHSNKVISKNQLTREEEQLLLSFDDRPPERTPKRIHSKQSNELTADETTVLKSNNVSEDLISLVDPPIDSFNSDQTNRRDTMMSSSSNNSSSNNNTSCLISGAIDEPLSLTNNQNNNQSNNLISSSSIDNLPPEYDQVYGDHSATNNQQDQGNRSPSSRSRISNDTNYSTGTGRYKVSAKIQQLLNTLKRPKKRPLDDFYKDDECDLQFIDPNGPKPEGSTMTPIIGEQLQVPSGLPKTLEEALKRYGSATFKGKF